MTGVTSQSILHLLALNSASSPEGQTAYAKDGSITSYAADARM